VNWSYADQMHLEHEPMYLRNQCYSSALNYTVNHHLTEQKYL